MTEFAGPAREILNMGLQHGLFIRIGIAAVILILQIIVIKLVWKLFGACRKKIDSAVEQKIKPFKIRNVQLLDKDHLRALFDFIGALIKWIITISLLVFTIPLILSLFAPTQELAQALFGYILAPLKNFGIAVLKYIPNIISIVVTIIISRYVLRLLKFFSRQIAAGRLKIQGFYPDWADMTFNILRILVYAFTVAIVFPLLPGSDSQIFQGVSILVGIIFSLGSSSAVGNLIAGIVITYMRPFKAGDFIKINDITGHIIEKNPMTTRVRTYKNEFISFPNLSILNASITNYTSSTENGQNGLIVHLDVTFTYHTPWQTVQELLITAAKKCEYIEDAPAPFVLQKSLLDFYCVYELNAFTKKVDKIPAVYSALNLNIQVEFAAAGLDLTAPHYYSTGGSAAGAQTQLQARSQAQTLLRTPQEDANAG